MICERCREAAEGLDIPVVVCSVCKRGPMSVYNDAKPVEQQSVVKHKKPGTRAGDFDYWCEGSKRPPVMSDGHSFCNGCPCQHRPRGSWKGDKK